MRYTNLRDLFEKLVRWWKGAPPVIVAPPEIIPAIETRPAAEPIAIPKPERSRGMMSFYFKEEILDQLDLYMKFIQRMKAADPLAYELYSHIGAPIIPDTALLTYDASLSAHWRTGYRGTFGCLAIGVGTKILEREAKWSEEDKTPQWMPRFIHYHRHAKAPPLIEQIEGGAVYLMAMHFDSFEDKKATPAQFYVHIDDQCRLHVLRELTIHTTKITHRDKWSKHHGARKTEIPTGVSLHIPAYVQGWAKEHAQRNNEPDLDVHTYVARIFATVAEAQERPSMIRIMASKGHLTAAFSVDMERTPYFFADRDASYNENGRKKRIFHIVRTHIRKSGTPVKTHFRGQRQFPWNGYAIHITVPGIHHNDLVNLQLSAHELSERGNFNRGFIGYKRFARNIQRHLLNGG